MARGRKRKAQEPEIPTVETQAPPEVPPPLEEVAEAVAAGEAEPGPEMPPEEIAQLQPFEVADLSVSNEGTQDPVPRAPGEGPTERLRRIVMGGDLPADVTGAQVSFGYRPNKWKDAEALIVAKVGDDGTIFIDLEVGGELARMVPYGSGTRCWKFREG